MIQMDLRQQTVHCKRGKRDTSTVVFYLKFCLSDKRVVYYTCFSCIVLLCFVFVSLSYIYSVHVQHTCIV